MPKLVLRRVAIALGLLVLGSGLLVGLGGANAATSHHDARLAANIRPGPAPQSVAAAIDQLQSDDAHAQAASAQWLSVAALDVAMRPDVLKALEPHVASDDRTLRLGSVQAYVHWGTRSEVPELLKIVAASSSTEAQDGSAGACAAAVIGLVRLDPLAAERGVRGRMDDFFFRDRTTLELQRMAEIEPAYSATAVELLKLIDPDDKSVQMSVRDAVKMLASDSAAARTDAANALKIAPVTEQDRGAVLRLLSTHLQSADGRTRLPFVRAFVHWSDSTNAVDLQQIVAFPETAELNRGNEDCWAFAIGGLVRLNMANAAIDAYNSRVEDRMLNFAVTRVMEDLARGTEPCQSLASDLLDQLKMPRASRLKPIVPSAPANSSAIRA